MSMSNTRFSRCIQVMGASFWSGFGSSGSRFGTMKSSGSKFPNSAQKPLVGLFRYLMDRVK